MDFAHFGGSMGSVVGEKVARLVEYAIANKLPVIIVLARVVLVCRKVY